MLGEYTNKKMAAASSCQLQNNTMIQARCYPSSVLCICLCLNHINNWFQFSFPLVSHYEPSTRTRYEQNLKLLVFTLFSMRTRKPYTCLSFAWKNNLTITTFSVRNHKCMFISKLPRVNGNRHF